MKRGIMLSITILSLLLLIGGCGQGSSTSGGIKDCAGDINCFTSAAKTCTPAKIDYNPTIDVFDGILQTSYNHYELMKGDGEKCSFSFVTNDVGVAFSDELLQVMKDAGSTQEEIDQQLQQMRSSYDLIIGKNGNCVGDGSEISAILKRWEDGSFSTSDWDNLECSGPYFDSQSGIGKGSISRGGSFKIGT